MPPSDALETRPNTLPSPPTPLIGREAEAAAIVGRLRRSRAVTDVGGHVRLLTLTGPGGIGKTRLAIHAGAGLVDAYLDGIYFVDLAPVATADLVVATIGTTLGLADRGDRPLLATLVEQVHDKHLLLILDNMEHVLAAAPEVSTLLQHSPDLVILATSRAPLRLQYEHEYPVPPLLVPDSALPPPVDQLLELASVRLFAQRAQAIRPDFSVNDSNATAVANICRRLEGMPLALELAAARIKVLAPDELQQRLADRLAVLTSGARDLPLRHQTLRNTIAWSYDLLTPDQQRLFRELGVFAGGWTFEAAEAVCAWQVDVLDGLTTLVDHSLVRIVSQTGEPTRFGMLETIREYALEQLDASGDADEVRGRHAAYWQATIEQWDLFSELTPETLARHRRVAVEHNNVRAALTWSLEHDPLLALELASAVWPFWNLRGYLREGRDWLERALSAAPDAPAAVRAHALLGAGTCASNQGNVAQAQQLLEQSLALHQALGNRSDVAFIHRHLGYGAYLNADYPTARAHSAESLAIGRELDDASTIAGALANLAAIALLEGNLTQAAVYAEEGMAIARRLRDTGGLYLSGQRLAFIALRQGDFARAREFLSELLASAQESGAPHGVVEFLAGHAAIAGRQGQFMRAARLAGASDALRETYSLAANRIAEQDIAPVRATADPVVWDAAWAEGRAMSREEAIAYALEPSARDSVESAAVVPGGLSKRELEVLRLVAQGLTDAEVAERLFIARRTVNTHLTSIYTKLGVGTRAAATRFAVERGLT